MEQYHTGDKIIDEGKQGEALVIDKVKSGDRKLYIESYGCQMNFSDSEIVASILADNGFETTKDIEAADVIFVNTCSIREKAEQQEEERKEKSSQHRNSIAATECTTCQIGEPAS